MQRCIRGHQACRQVQRDIADKRDRDTVLGPKRLLHISALPDAPTVSLVDNCSPWNEYVALSYRRDSSHVLKRSLAVNEASHGKNIPIDRLPQRIFDAVKITRLLGIRYLWVDALCIIQDDHQEWKAECSRMGDIYALAAITIVITTATTLNDHVDVRDMQSDVCGSLLPRSGWNLVQLEKRASNGSVVPHEHFCLSAGFQQQFNTIWLSPWASRRWVFQERLLSTRILFVSEDRLFVACRESYPKGEQGNGSTEGGWESFHLKANGPFWKTAYKNIFLDRGIVMSDWLALIEDYSKCDSTDPNDKLAAISGLVETVKLRWNVSFHDAGGIWFRDLHWQLLWASKASYMPASRSQRAPSWSWLSLDGRGGISWKWVMMKGKLLGFADQDANIGLLPPGLPSESRRLVICSQMKLVRYTKQSIMIDAFIPKYKDGALVDTEGWVVVIRDAADTRSDDDAARIGIASFDVLSEVLDDDLWAVKVITHDLSHVGQTTHRAFYCLLIQRVRGDVTFRRVGVAEISSTALFDGLPRNTVTVV
jgi:hypothetical protein